MISARVVHIASIMLAAVWIAPTGMARGATLNGLLDREGSLLAALQSRVRELVAHDAELARLKHEQRVTDYEITETERRISALQERLAERREQLQTRLVALYKLSQGGYARLLVDSDGRDDALRTLAATKRLVQRDAAELGQQQSELEQIQRLRVQLAAKRELRARLVQQQQVGSDQLNRQVRLMRREIDRVHGSRVARQKLNTELTGAQRKLLRRVIRARSQVRASGGLLARRGRLPRPVRGWVVSRPGPMKVARGRLSVSRSGATFGCPRRASVRAVHGGWVALSQPVDGYGHVVLIDHGDGYFTLSGFLSRVMVRSGQRVEAGDRIGRAGRDPLTGRAAVYFELRRHEQPLDPLPWLRRD